MTPTKHPGIKTPLSEDTGPLETLAQRTLARPRPIEKTPGALAHLGQKIREWGYAIDLYNWRLSGRHPLKVDRVIDDSRPGNMARGDALISAILDGKKDTEQAARYWAGDIQDQRADHSFAFLTDLSKAREQLAARAVASALTDAWCDQNLTWQPDAWSGAQCARRLLNWLANVPLVLASSDLVYRSRVLLAVARQMRHLPRVVKDIDRLTDQAAAGAALALAGMLLPGAAAQKEKGYRFLSASVQALILPDGSPATQATADLVDCLHILALVRSAAEKSQTVFPHDLQSAIDKAGPFLRSQYHSGDQGVRLMGGIAQDKAETLALLETLGATGSAGTSFPHGGFYRLEASGTVLVASAAPAVRGRASVNCAAETGAIEISSSGDLLISAMGQSSLDDFKGVTRATAAHSALTLDNRHVTEIATGPQGTLGILGSGVERTVCRRRRRRDGEDLTITQDGYQKRLGYKHTRSLHLSRDGLVITGSDSLTATRTKAPACPVDIWFHLPPGVKARQSKEGDIILLTPTKKIWVMTVKGAEAGLEPSVFFTDPETPAATTAIRLFRAAVHEPAGAILWTLTRRE